MLRSMRVTLWLAALLIASPVRADESGAPSPPAPGPCTDATELLILAPTEVLRVRVEIERDGTSLSKLWDAVFVSLRRWADRDGDGALDASEATALPSPFALRQVAWGQFATTPANAIPFDQIDLDGDGKATDSELTDYYRRMGLGNALIGAGTSAISEELTRALVRKLDADSNGQLTEAEWSTAPRLLTEADADENELLEAEELLPRTKYPGTTGATLLSAPRGSATADASQGRFPVIVLPLRLDDGEWCHALRLRIGTDSHGDLTARAIPISKQRFVSLDRDADGKLSDDELMAWRSLPADYEWKVRLHSESAGATSPEPELFRIERDRLLVELRIDKGNPEPIAAAAKRMRERFAAADTNSDGALDAAELEGRRTSELSQIRIAADRDGDSRLNEAELSQWLEIQQQIDRAHARVMFVDFGAGLFEALDQNRDGALSLRELRCAWQALSQAGGVKNGVCDPAGLRRLISAVASSGSPGTRLSTSTGSGPDWFRAMDRNHDGDLSLREFTGDPEAFQKLDRDGDGLLSATEATVGVPESSVR